jgi:hypothetical protein
MVCGEITDVGVANETARCNSMQNGDDLRQKRAGAQEKNPLQKSLLWTNEKQIKPGQPPENSWGPPSKSPAHAEGSARETDLN